MLPLSWLRRLPSQFISEVHQKCQTRGELLGPRPLQARQTRDLPAFPAGNPRHSEPPQENFLKTAGGTRQAAARKDPTPRPPRGSFGFWGGPGVAEWDGEGRKSWGRRHPSHWNFCGNLARRLRLASGILWRISADSGLSPGRGRRNAGSPGILGRGWGGKCFDYPHFSACGAAFWEKCHRDAPG